MDRGPGRAPWIAGAAVLSWITLHVRLRLLQGRPGAQAQAPLGAALHHLARLSTLVATQSLIQLSLFFALPFYVAAATLDFGHVAFMAALGLMALVALWDPWSERVLCRPVLGLLFPACSSFVALNAVLPGLGLSNPRAMWVAALLASLPIAVAGLGRRIDPAELRPPPRRLWTLALLLPAFVALGGARIIPAAPMRLVRIELGTQVADHWVTDPIERLPGTPERLVCATAVFAPLGVREQLVHIWSVDGTDRHRIELTIRGGRTAGFRTYSRIRRPRAPARWSCRVETASGQRLGGASVTLDVPRSYSLI